MSEEHLQTSKLLATNRTVDDDHMELHVHINLVSDRLYYIVKIIDNVVFFDTYEGAMRYFNSKLTNDAA